MSKSAPTSNHDECWQMRHMSTHTKDEDTMNHQKTPCTLNEMYWHLTFVLVQNEVWYEKFTMKPVLVNNVWVIGANWPRTLQWRPRATASQITSLRIVHSTVYSRRRSKKHQNSASVAFVGGIHLWPVNSLHKGSVTRKMFPFDNVIMNIGAVPLLIAWMCSGCWWTAFPR